MKRRDILILTAVLLLLSTAFTLSSCAVKVKADDLMQGIPLGQGEGKETDEDFILSHAKFSLDIFKRTAEEKKLENILVSPLSVRTALAMTANGAEGETLKEMESVLGKGITIDELNKYLHTYTDSLPSEKGSKLESANSIWFRNNELKVFDSFLKTNADYYRANAYAAPFNGETVEDMNAWVSKHTDGMIKKIIEEITGDNMLFLLNAIVFDSEWEKKYTSDDIRDRVFTNIEDIKKTVKMMYSEESIYLEDEHAKGFMKQYKGGHYSFAALLPEEGMDIYDYVESLTAEGLMKTLSEGRINSEVSVGIPKFSYEFEISMNDILKAMGMKRAFEGGSAEFHRMAEAEGGELFISDVLHKTFISVDEKGTKAAAVTKVEVSRESCDTEPRRTVYLDRPFVYMIVDNATSLPVFMGLATDIEA